MLADTLRDAGHVFLKGVGADGTRVGWLWVTPAPALLGEDRERNCRRHQARSSFRKTSRAYLYGEAGLSSRAATRSPAADNASASSGSVSRKPR